jgi:YidC/Oxa1 family membrane protein insertase
VIRNNPAPGTPAYAAKQRRDADKASRHGRPAEVATETAAGSEAQAGGAATTDRRPAQRQQPRRQSREQRRRSTGPAPQASSADSGEPAEPGDQPDARRPSGPEEPGSKKPDSKGPGSRGLGDPVKRDRPGGAARQRPREKKPTKGRGNSTGNGKRQGKGEDQ